MFIINSRKQLFSESGDLVGLAEEYISAQCSNILFCGAHLCVLVSYCVWYLQISGVLGTKLFFLLFLFKKFEHGRGVNILCDISIKNEESGYRDFCGFRSGFIHGVLLYGLYSTFTIQNQVFGFGQ